MILAQQSLSPGREQLMAWLTWDTKAGCALHDFHNGYKKGMAAYLEDRAFMVSLFGCVESLRDCCTSLVMGLPDWLPTVITWEDWDLPEDQQRALWLLLGVKQETLDALLSLQLRFSGGRLRVATGMRDQADSVAMILTVLTILLQFPAWTDSRWASMGRTSRRMLGAFLVGLPQLVDFLQHRKRISEYHIKAYVQNVSDKHKRCFVIGAVASQLSDAVLYVIMQDNRLPLRLGVVDEAIRDKVKWACELSTDVWALLAAVCSSSGESLRAECIDVALTSVGYMEMRLREARRLPWTLLGPEKERKLEELKASPKPQETVSGKIWELLQHSIFDGVVLSGLKCLEDAPWSTAAVEAGHASTTMMLRYHSYDDKCLRARSTMSQARVFFGVNSDVKKIKKLRARLQNLRSKRPGRLTGRHVYISWYVKQYISLTNCFYCI